MSKKNVFIPLVIKCIVLGIWFYKNEEVGKIIHEKS